MKNRLFIWLLLLIGITLFSRGCNSTAVNPKDIPAEAISIYTNKTSYSLNQEIKLTVQNNTAEKITLSNLCPEEPLDVWRYGDGDFQQIKSANNINCDNIPAEIELNPNQKTAINYKYWTHELFSLLGRYQISLTINDKTYRSNEFIVGPESLWHKAWQQIVYRPIYNVLMFFASILPKHDLGLSIILLTIAIRTLLLLPSQKALRAQKRLQEVQPKLKHVQEKHKGDHQKIAEETMKLWKEHKVNPLSSCLPILIQFPILIALFYVVQDVLNPNNVYILYEALKGFNPSQINVQFLGILNLTKVNSIILPLIIGGLQFIQIKLTLVRKPTQTKEKKTGSDLPDQMEMMNKTMAYVMPVMIAVFTASLPSAIGIYWGVTTLFSIGQQLIVNREKDKDAPEVKIVS